MLHICKFNNAFIFFPAFLLVLVMSCVFVQLLSLPSLVWGCTAVWQLHKLSFPTSGARFPSAQFDLWPQHPPLGKIELLLSVSLSTPACYNLQKLSPTFTRGQKVCSRRIRFLRLLYFLLTNPPHYAFTHEESVQRAHITSVAELSFVFMIWPFIVAINWKTCI